LPRIVPGVMNEDLWRFDRLTIDDPDRARRLHGAPIWAEMIELASEALRASLSTGVARFGFDESSRNANDLRATVQFPVREELFDWFFNAHSGYRAQFRKGWENGLAGNANLVARLRGVIAQHKPGSIAARRLNHKFDDLEPISANSQDIVASLDPSLSKVWCCERLIGSDGGVADLYVSRTGPKLVFGNECEPWSSLYAEAGGAWLDLKGAF